MSGRRKRALLAAVISIFIVAAAFVDGLFDVARALGEYLRPSTASGILLPQGCIETTEPPPTDLTLIVENLRGLYHLAFQKLVTCKSARRLPALEGRFVGLPFAFAEGSDCRPLSMGCCSCQFGRHVIIEVADHRDSGSVLVEAALLQSRRDYLRFNWHRVRGSWLWRWTGMWFWTYLLLFGLSGAALAVAIKRFLTPTTPKTPGPRD